MRGHYEGTWNVVRFNWPKYALGVVVLMSATGIAIATEGRWALVFTLVSVMAALALVLPLLVSHLIYDRSDLYSFPGMRDLPDGWNGTVLNLNAGFDESSAAIRSRWPDCTLQVADFYDPARHTERSIERARSRYPSHAGTSITTVELKGHADGSVDRVHAFLSLHEVRDPQERIRALTAMHRVLSPDGRVIITEHLRDVPNFLAFNFGFLHFHSHATWSHAFSRAGLELERTVRTTPFITTFILRMR